MDAQGSSSTPQGQQASSPAATLPHTAAPAPPRVLQLPACVLQHIATVCKRPYHIRSLRSACRTLRAVQPASIGLTWRLGRDPQGRLRVEWRQHLSLGKALAAKWAGVQQAFSLSRVFEEYTQQGVWPDLLPGQGRLGEEEWGTMQRALDEAAAQLVHWRQLQEVHLSGIMSKRLVAAMVGSCTNLHTLRLGPHSVDVFDPDPNILASSSSSLLWSLEHLAECSSLRRMTLVYCSRLPPSLLEGTCTALGQLTQLQMLWLEYGDDDRELDASALSSSFNRLSRLTKLGICSSGGVAGEWRVGPLPELVELQLEHRSEGGALPCTTLLECPQLSIVVLSGSWPCAEAVPAVLPALQHLDLGYTTTASQLDVAWLAACCPQLTSLNASRVRVSGPAGGGCCLPYLQDVWVGEFSCQRVLLADLMPRLTSLGYCIAEWDGPNEPADELACESNMQLKAACFLRCHPSLAELRIDGVLREEAARAVLSCPQLTSLQATVMHVPGDLTAAEASTSLQLLCLFQELHCPVPLALCAPNLMRLEVDDDMSHTFANFLHGSPRRLEFFTSMQWVDPAAEEVVPVAAADVAAATNDPAGSVVFNAAAVAAAADNATLHGTPATTTSPAFAGIGRLELKAGGATSLEELQTSVPPAWLRGFGSNFTHLTIRPSAVIEIVQLVRLLPWLRCVQVLHWGDIDASGAEAELVLSGPTGCFPNDERIPAADVAELLVSLAPFMVDELQQLRVVQVWMVWDGSAKDTLRGVPLLTMWLKALSQSRSLRLVRMHVRAKPEEVAGAEAKLHMQIACAGRSLSFEIELRVTAV